jgi:hypothetical protein
MAPIVYCVIVITVILSGAWLVFGDSQLDTSGRIMVFGSALRF